MSDISSEEILSIVESTGDLISGISIPNPIRKNLLTALGQLCSAAIDIPTSYLEGVASEKRAETSARLTLMHETGNQIAKRMAVPEPYVVAAQNKYAGKIVREQVNLDKIANQAINEIAIKNSQASFDKDLTGASNIDPDWLNSFELEARNKSTAEIQQLFGKILAGEIVKPASFSIKTIRLVSQIDTLTAQLFVKFCSICTSISTEEKLLDSRVISLGGYAAQNALHGHGLNFDQLNILQEHGLVIAELNSWRDFGGSVVNNGEYQFSFKFANDNWVLNATDVTQPQQMLCLYGVALTRAGMELLEIIDIAPNEAYRKELNDYFNSIGFTMTKANPKALKL